MKIPGSETVKLRSILISADEVKVPPLMVKLVAISIDPPVVKVPPLTVKVVPTVSVFSPASNVPVD